MTEGNAGADAEVQHVFARLVEGAGERLLSQVTEAMVGVAPEAAANRNQGLSLQEDVLDAQVELGGVLERRL